MIINSKFSYMLFWIKMFLDMEKSRNMKLFSISSNLIEIKLFAVYT